MLSTLLSMNNNDLTAMISQLDDTSFSNICSMIDNAFSVLHLSGLNTDSLYDLHETICSVRYENW